MRRVALYTADGEFVAVVEILPFGKNPDVVLWGSRTFVLAPLSVGSDCYVETFFSTSLTPSPGLPLLLPAKFPQRLALAGEAGRSGGYKLGRKPRRPGARHLELARLAIMPGAQLPPAPPAWDGTPGARFALYRNDTIGDCTAAAVANLAALQSAAEGRQAGFADGDVLALFYGAGGTADGGAVESDVLARVAASGLPMLPGMGVYQIDGWAAVAVSNLDEVRAAAATFLGLLVGADLPAGLEAIAGDPSAVWDVLEGPQGEPGSWGGHEMVLVAFDAAGVTFATWGGTRRATWAWWQKYVSDADVVLDKARAQAVGINWQALESEIAALRAQAQP